MTPAHPPYRLLTLVVLLCVAAFVGVQALTAPVATPVVAGRNPLLDRPAPAIDLVALDGRRVRLEDYRGRPVIVNFWASYCDPCREEFALYREQREQHAAAGLEILGVIRSDDSLEAARGFARAQRASWPLLTDPQDAAWNAYGGTGLPTSFFIDRTGVVRAVSYGPPPPDVLAQQLARIL